MAVIGGGWSLTVSRTVVEAAHGGVHAVGQHGLHGVRRLLHHDVQLVGFGPTRAAQHVVGTRPAAWRATDSDADPEVVLGLQVGGDGPQAVMASQAAPRLDP